MPPYRGSSIAWLFVANRGEIAVRIVTACRKMGIETVVGVSEVDRHTLAAQMAGRAIRIGPAPALVGFKASGVHSTLLFHRAVLAHPVFRNGLVPHAMDRAGLS